MDQKAKEWFKLAAVIALGGIVLCYFSWTGLLPGLVLVSVALSAGFAGVYYLARSKSLLICWMCFIMQVVCLTFGGVLLYLFVHRSLLS